MVTCKPAKVTKMSSLMPADSDTQWYRSQAKGEARRSSTERKMPPASNATSMK